MKKVISVVLAVLMLFSCFAVVGLADDSSNEEKKVTASDSSCVSLVFNYLSYDVGNIYYGDTATITDGANKGCLVLRGDMCTAGNFVQLPGIKNAPEGYAGAWYLSSGMSTGLNVGATYACGSMFQIPETAKNGEYIVFTAVVTPVETTSTLAKIANIFAKIITVLFGTEAGNKFKNILDQIIAA